MIRVYKLSVYENDDDNDDKNNNNNTIDANINKWSYHSQTNTTTQNFTT
jgi:hypothetical protein